MTVHTGYEGSDAATLLRRLLLALVLVGAVGLIVELLLLEHYESVWQWTPLALLAGVLVTGLLLVRWPSRRALRLFQGMMVLCVVAGALGILLHYRGNVEFELERDPERRGLALFWEAIRGATPALAPAALSQLGLLGLLFAFRHPVLYDLPPVRPPRAGAANPEETR